MQNAHETRKGQRPARPRVVCPDAACVPAASEVCAALATRHQTADRPLLGVHRQQQRRFLDRMATHVATRLEVEATALQGHRRTHGNRLRRKDAAGRQTQVFAIRDHPLADRRMRWETRDAGDDNGLRNMEKIESAPRGGYQCAPLWILIAGACGSNWPATDTNQGNFDRSIGPLRIRLLRSTMRLASAKANCVESCAAAT